MLQSGSTAAVRPPAFKTAAKNHFRFLASDLAPCQKLTKFKPVKPGGEEGEEKARFNKYFP